MCTNDEYNNLDKYTNEQLVIYIQDTNEEKYWLKLYSNTEGCIFNIYHKKVHKFYKDTMKEDILSLLKIGWTKAVVKYDINKATSSFVAWASTLIEQEYVNFAKRRTKTREGTSVRYDLLESLHSSSLKNADRKDKVINGCIANILEDKNSNKELEEFEIKNLVNQKLKVLKNYCPISYYILVNNNFYHKTQNEIAKKFGLKQTTISRYSKLGKIYLKKIITEDEKELCFYNKFN